MIATEQPRKHGPTRSLPWLVHDLAVGSIVGGLVGFVLTWFRHAVGLYIDGWPVELGAIALGAAGGITALRLERRSRGVGPVTVTVWALGLGAIVFMALVVYALSQFE